MAAQDDLNDWNPMEDDYKNASFNSYNKGPGADFLKPLDKAPTSYQVFVNNIPMDLTEAGFGNYFRVGGLSPLAVKKCRPKQQGADTTFGFVTYATVKDCESAINQLNGHKIGKCTLRVTLARPQQEQRVSELRTTIPGYSAFSSELGSSSRNGKDKPMNVEPSLSDEPLASETQRAVKGAGRGFAASRATTAYSYGADGDCRGVTGISRGFARPKNSSNEKPGINDLEPPSPNIRSAGVFGSAVSPTSSATAASRPVMPAGRAASVISPIQSHRAPSRIAVAEKESSPPSKEVKCILPKENLCSVCLRIGKHAIGHMRCSQCKLPYCSRNCQLADWPKHKALCKVSAESEFESNFEVSISHDRLNDIMSVALNENGLSLLPASRHPFMADRLPKTHLERGQRVQAELCYYRDPSFFWIQLVDNGEHKKKRSDLERLIVQCLRDTSDSNSEYRPVPGELCLARWSADKNWYRVAVKDVDSDATVLFIDYGNEEKVGFSAIRPMDESLAEHPQQAILCMLADLKPISGDSWSDQVPLVCQDNGLMLYSTIEVQCVTGAVSGKPTQIKVFLANGKELGDTLIESHLAVRTSVPRHVVKQSLHEDLKVGEPVTVFIVVESIVSPGEFTAQVLASRHKAILGAWEEMSAVLRNAPPVPVSSSYKYLVGDFVQARFVDGWYRARILRVISADQLELCYIDFGNVEVRSSSDVCPLSSAYVDVPCLSCQCSLVCEAQREASRQGKWPQEYATAMTKAVSSCATYEGYVKGKDEATGRLILEVPKLAAVIDALIQMPAPAGRAAGLEGSEALSRDSRPCSGETTLHIGGKSAVNKPGKTVIRASSLGPNNGRVRAFVTYVCPKSAGLFYIQGITSESLEFYKINEELITLADQAQVPSSEVTAGEAFSGLSSADQTWYRCRIVEVYQSKAEVLVYYVDYGNDEVLPISALRRLPAKYATLPAQATACRLSGTDDLNQRTIYNSLKSLEMKKINVTVLEFDSFEQEVRLIDIYDDTGLHINLNLRMQNRSQHVCSPSESKPTTSLPSHGNGLLQAQPPPARRHTLAESVATANPRKELFNIFVTHIVSPKHFYGQIPSEDVKKLDEVMVGFSSDAMRNMEFTPVLDDWIVGELVVAKWKDDGCWYRGVITSLELNSAGVRFVDYGNEANVPYTDIRVPSSALIGIPKQAIHMSLYKFDEGSISSADHPAVKKQFECLTSNEILRATLVAQTDDGFVVSLTNQKGKDISDLLAASTPMKSLRAVDLTSDIATQANENPLKDRGFLVKKITSLQEETSLLVKKLASMQDELSILQEHLRRLDAAGVH